MSDRGQHRGGRGGGGRGESSRGGGRGGRGGGGGRGGAAAIGDKPKKENILDLGKYVDKRIVVKFTGGREGGILLSALGIRGLIGGGSGLRMSANASKLVNGTLKGYDALMNLVLDDVQEVLRGILISPPFPVLIVQLLIYLCYSDDEGNTSSRSLGLVVARGTLLVLVSPVDGSEEIANPFVQAEE
jgi:U6 snRNA-associated Sm-like protein LSm7